MTKAEAIAMLKRIQEPEAWEPQINQAAFEALDMAIEALSQESSEDVISRQAVLRLPRDTTRNFFGEIVEESINVEEIEALPSAQPEIIRCKDCKWFGDIDCAIEIVDDSDRPSENDFCSYAERRTDVKADKGASR